MHRRKKIAENCLRGAESARGKSEDAEIFTKIPLHFAVVSAIIPSYLFFTGDKMTARFTRTDEREFKIQFTRKALALLIVPLIIEQTLGLLMGIVDTMMVSGLGDAAVSGVSLVDMLCALFINMFSALATTAPSVRVIPQKPDGVRSGCW